MFHTSIFCKPSQEHILHVIHGKKWHIVSNAFLGLFSKINVEAKALFSGVYFSGLMLITVILVDFDFMKSMYLNYGGQIGQIERSTLCHHK